MYLRNAIVFLSSIKNCALEPKCSIFIEAARLNPIDDRIMATSQIKCDRYNLILNRKENATYEVMELKNKSLEPPA